MSVSIKVAVRCRPFTIDDNLGVQMTQRTEEEGEIDILNSTYSTTRFAFTYAWWSAFGFVRHLQSNTAEAEAMELIDQEKVFHSVGTKIKADLLAGNAVVLFAYGLSGSGKTFTVFGPDAVEEPEAWFKHSKPHPMWGIFPRLAYDVFKQKEDGWKITMKYFQNVVDTVRDLMSPVGKEMHYKNGMKKDTDGFTDIEWCSSAVLDSWDDLRSAFRAANARKAIAPTQFNHQSTRGHCIMTLEVEMPHPTMSGMKQKGRVYVCDLAGTEPAGDIVYACYEKKVFDSRDIEYKYLGPHPDMRKTKELQDQGKKINLSLSEMAQFFMKMAEAVQNGSLKPGLSIPGCNSYFLCKYLKDTMLQARTYLFCAIRPEVTYHKYTFSTLGFAKNASVVKLKPKMTTVQATPAERKLMEELEQMKALVEQLRKQQADIIDTPSRELPSNVPPAEGKAPLEAGEDAKLTTPRQASARILEQRDLTNSEGEREIGVGPGVEDGTGLVETTSDSLKQESITKNAEEVTRLQELLEAKQKELKEVLSGGGSEREGPTPEERQLEQQREEYSRRGISLSHFEADTRLPHLINVDEDPFRHNRFIYLFRKPVTVFGPHGDVQPMSLSVQRKHCSVEVKRGDDDTGGTVTLIGGRGEVLRNGKRVRKQEKVILSLFDRVAIGSELLLFRWKELETPDTPPPPAAESAVMEFKRAMQKGRGGRRRSVEVHTMEAQLKELQVEKAKAEKEVMAVAEKADQLGSSSVLGVRGQLDDSTISMVIASAEEEVQGLLPRVKETEQFMQLFGREYLSFDVSLQHSQGETFEITTSVRVENSRTGQACYVSSFEFVEYHSIFSDEVAQVRAALDNQREYTVPAEHDPSLLLLQGTHQLGIATVFTEPIVYMMATEKEERFTLIKDVRAPFGEVGRLESAWHPLVIGAEGKPVEPDIWEDDELGLPEIDSPEDLIGMPWAYRFEIKACIGLPLTCSSAYCQYDLLGETYTTETVQPDPPSSSPEFNYSFVHRVDKVTKEIVEGLVKPLNIYLCVGPYVEPESVENIISTTNSGVTARFEALSRPGTSSPLPSPTRTRMLDLKDLCGEDPTTVIPSSLTAQDAPAGDGSGDAVAPISWGPGPACPSTPAEGGNKAVMAEVIALRKENAELRKELEEARATIATLRERSSGDRGKRKVPGPRKGEGAERDEDAPQAISNCSTPRDHQRENPAETVEEKRAQGTSRKAERGTKEKEKEKEKEQEREPSDQESREGRKSRSRKKIDIDTARATDAAIEAGVVTVTNAPDVGEVLAAGSPATAEDETEQRADEGGAPGETETTVPK